MKIALSGRHSLQELRSALDGIVDILEQSGVDAVQGTNLYLFLYQEGIPLIIEGDDGKEIKDLRFALHEMELVQIPDKPARAKMPANNKFDGD